MKKILKLFVSFIVLVLYALSSNKVKANGDYSSIYFYSNNQENYNASQGYIRNLALSSNINSNNVHMIFEPHDIFEEYISLQYLTGAFNYSNALVIFDMSAGIMENHETTIDSEAYFTRRLKAIFCELKESNCKIMFICGTQEIRFSSPGEARNSEGNFNEFLDYVDIHINVSQFDPFYMSMIVKIEEETNGRDATLIFDENSKLYDKVINYYQRKYRKDYFPVKGQYNSFEEYLYDSCNFQIIRYNNMDESFIDYDGFIWYDVSDLIRNNVVYAIGMMNNESYFSNWIEKINHANTQMNYAKWSVFVYNQLSVNILDYNILGTLYYSREYKYERYNIKMNYVIYDFIYGEDLTIYNNRQGRCQITYRPFSSSEQEWLYDFEYDENSDEEAYDFGYICIYGSYEDILD